MNHEETLWDRWKNAYPDVSFTKDVLHGIEHGHKHQGSFAEALLSNNESRAMATADPWNLPRFEKLIGITKNEYGVRNWGWPKEE